MLVVFAAQHYAFQIALPNSQRRGSVLPRSRRDQARKAFEKLVKPALPGTHAQLARTIEREAREHHKRADELRARHATTRAEHGRDGEDLDDDVTVNELDAEPVDEDLDEAAAAA